MLASTVPIIFIVSWIKVAWLLFLLGYDLTALEHFLTK